MILVVVILTKGNHFLTNSRNKDMKEHSSRTQLKDSISEEMMRQMGGLGGAGAQATSSAEMGDMTKKAYQRPTLDDLDIEEEEEDDMPDLE